MLIMSDLWAIIKITLKSTLRSKIFILLFVLLILCVFLVPNTISSDGTVSGFIRISLQYSLSIIAFILSLSTIWLGCFIITRDVENYQIHLVSSKPISRVKIWIGKFLGILFVHAVLLFAGAAVVYGFIIWQFNKRDFSEEEKNKIKNEVLVGREVFMPAMPDITSMVQKAYKKKIAELEEKNLSTDFSAQEKRNMIKNLRKQIIAGLSEVQPGVSKQKSWNYYGLPKDTDSPVFVRYRNYLGKISTKDQRSTLGRWFAMKQLKKGKGEDSDSADTSVSEVPAEIPWASGRNMTGVFHEFMLPNSAVNDKGELTLMYMNFDPARKSVFFQAADGPKVLVKQTGFFNNYMRAVLILFMRLVLLAGLACTAGAFLYMPTAVFVVISYLLIGSLASYLLGERALYGESLAGHSSVGIVETVGYTVSEVLMWGVIPMQKFEVSEKVASGELVTGYFIGVMTVKYLILRGIPLFIFGIYMYRKRELGLVIRK